MFIVVHSWVIKSLGTNSAISCSKSSNSSTNSAIDLPALPVNFIVSIASLVDNGPPTWSLANSSIFSIVFSPIPLLGTATALLKAVKSCSLTNSLK